MIKENQRLLYQLNILSDGILVFLSMLLAYWVRFYVFDGSINISVRDNIILAATAAIVLIIIFSVMGLYESFRVQYLYREISLVFVSLLLDTLILVVVLFLMHLVDVSRWQLVIFFVISLILLSLKRLSLRLILRRFRQKGFNQKHVLIVGSGDMAERYLNAVLTRRELGYTPIGFVADGGEGLSLPRLGNYSDLDYVLNTNIPDEVVVAVDSEDYRKMPEIISACEKSGTKLTLIPFYASYMPSNPQVDSIGGIPMINLRRIPLDNLGNAFLKRLFDIVISLILIIITSPLMLITAIGVKLSSPGPVIFKQERVGLNKKFFTMYKFRSMRVNDAQQTGWSTTVDDRRTKFGAFIRKSSIDELPQFFNVLVGDMSLVGPRPEVPFYVEQFKEEVPRYMVKHQVRPGITGWAQVNGLRGDTSIITRIEYDLEYIENWDLLFDVKVLFMTAFHAINREKLKAPPLEKERGDETVMR